MELIHTSGSNVEQDSDERRLELGQWYWLKSGRPEDHDDVGAPEGYHWIACIVHIGSNFVRLESPEYKGNKFVGHVRELLFSELFEVGKYEPDPQSIFTKNVLKNQTAIKQTLKNINSLCERVGVTPQQLQSSTESSGNTDLVVVNRTTDIAAYKGALLKAKDQDLPALFKELDKYNNNIARWLGAETTALKAQMSVYKSTISDIQERVFNVALYAGIEEQCAKIQSGEPAPEDSKIHVMQRRLYMDEECLVDYDAGGMGFDELDDFDEWLLRPDNLNRLLPHQRCIVAMRVRRNKKEYEDDGTVNDMFINFRHNIDDKITYLYVRNGECVYRVNTEIEFDEMLFPDDVKALSEPVMVKVSFNKVESIITVREYEDRAKEQERMDQLHRQWIRDNPEKEWKAKPENAHKSWQWSNPYDDCVNGFNRFDPRDWYPSDDSTSKYDIIHAHITEEIRKYNRIVLILQGLLDRSELLHPHPPIQLSRQKDFSRYISLHYDASRVLTYGEAPNFEEYRARCNAQITQSSVFVGQQHAWLVKEVEKENAKRDRSRYSNHIGLCNSYIPRGNKGPGVIACTEKLMPRSKKARFRWRREGTTSATYGTWVPTTITVPVDQLLNVSAYQKGDYRRFFEDPRTRQQYLKWAPFLLAAEDFACGKRKASQPIID